MADKTSAVPQFPCNYCGGKQTEKEDGTVLTDNSAHTKICPLYSEPQLSLTQVERLIEDIAVRVQANHDANHFKNIIVSSSDGHLRDAKSWDCHKCLETVAIIRATNIGNLTNRD